MISKKLTILLLLIPCFLTLFAQDKNIPEFYGIYLFANQQLFELEAKEVGYVRPKGDSANAEHVFGIKALSKTDVNDSSCYIIIYKEDMSINDIKLTKLQFVKESLLTCRPLSGSPYKKMTRINMWIKEKNIEFRVGRVEEKKRMYKIAPREPLERGVYAINTGCFRRFIGNFLSLNLETTEIGKEAYVFTVSFKQRQAEKTMKNIKAENLGKGPEIEPFEKGNQLLKEMKLKQSLIHHRNYVRVKASRSASAHLKVGYSCLNLASEYLNQVGEYLNKKDVKQLKLYYSWAIYHFEKFLILEPDLEKSTDVKKLLDNTIKTYRKIKKGKKIQKDCLSAFFQN